MLNIDYRQPGRLFGFDCSSTQLGRSMTRNRIGLSIGHLTDPSWTQSVMSDFIKNIKKPQIPSKKGMQCT